MAAGGKLRTLQLELSAVPDAVQRVIKAHIADHKLGRITRNEEAAEVVYEVAMIKGGKEFTFTVAAGGWIVNEQIALADAPGEVQTAIKHKLGDAELLWLERTDEDGEVSFNIGTRSAGSTSAIWASCSASRCC